MGKKKEADGAPAYFGLFCTLQIVLLAFFILLNTMAETQESGFKSGVGAIQNAFGVMGGFGIFEFVYVGRGKRHVPVPAEFREEEEGVVGLADPPLRGEGGAGHVDTKPDKPSLGRRVTVAVPYTFAPDSIIIPKKMAAYLQAAGTGFTLFGHQVGVACYTRETGDPVKDQDLASKRAASIMRFLHDQCGMDLALMHAVGYGHEQFVRRTGEGRTATQSITFRVFRKEAK